MTDIGYFDGACQPENPGGHGGWGFVIRDDNGKVIAEGSGYLPQKKWMTNNVVEYSAALAALVAYKKLGRTCGLKLHGDSKLVVMQVKGKWGAKKGAYLPVYEKLKAFLSGCPFRVEWIWVPREQNQEADDLSKRELVKRGIAA